MFLFFADLKMENIGSKDTEKESIQALTQQIKNLSDDASFELLQSIQNNIYYGKLRRGLKKKVSNLLQKRSNEQFQKTTGSTTEPSKEVSEFVKDFLARTKNMFDDEE